MAQRYYGLDRGETKNNTTEGAATTATTDVEVRVDLESNITRNEVLIALDDIKNYILEHSWPPA